MVTEPVFLIRSHEMTVHVVPREHRLHAVDRMTVQVNVNGPERFSVSLNSSLRIERVRLLTSSGDQSLSARRDDPNDPSRVSVQLPGPPSAGEIMTMEWEYEGVINDPPREPRHLRFVTPSETAGHIGEEGVYLSGETHWYPDVDGQLSIYRLTVTVPEGWETVSHGRQTGRTASSREGQATLTETWNVPDKTEALTLVANRFVKGQRDWKGIEISTYLFPEEAKLSEEYLDAAIRYLEVYIRLLGPYPFPKFAVVENFFASGLGMPSFTLLGSGVIKRHYVQAYALGHEIVHSWFGNSVFNDTNHGNWVEGLTTYLANYYYDELTGTAEQAREHRRMMLLGYAVYVRPSEDYPVGQFTHKSNQKDNAVGYQKSAMIFHMLRQEIGDEAFWRGIRRLVAERTGSYTTWQDVERIFGLVAARDLRWFFAQWVEKAGAPLLAVAEARVRPGGQPGSGQFTAEITVQQQEPVFRFGLPVSVSLADGREMGVIVQLNGARQSFTIPLSSGPVRLRLDPDWNVFRRLDRAKIPPTLNLFVTDGERVIVTPGGGDESERQPYEELAARVMAAEPGTGASDGGARTRRYSDREAMSADSLSRIPGSVLVLGPPGMNQATQWAANGCDHRIGVEPGRFTVQGRTYDRPDHALLLTCRHPDRPGHVVTLFYGHSQAAIAKVGRLLFFYGWQSYLIFQDGAVVTRGDFKDSRGELEVAFDHGDK